jgi:hypothetical protein
MTVTQHGVPGPEHGPPHGPQVPGPLAPAAAPPGPDWRYAPPPPRRSKGMAIAVAAAIVLAIAALVIGIVDLTRSSPAAAPAATTPTAPGPTSAPADTTSANRALCTAIAPLMTEDNRVAKTLSSLAPAGSPAWNAAVPKFVSDTKDWVGRIQPVIDSHPDVDPYFRRSLQRFVDDQRALAGDLEAGPWQAYDQTIWDDGLGAGTGPLSICWDLGVKW